TCGPGAAGDGFMPAACTSAPWSAEDWCAHFRRNAVDRLPLPWDKGAELTDAERALVASSLPGFQLGESVAGPHLFPKAQTYARRTGDWAYVDALKLFVKEEQRHSHDMGRFLDAAGVSRWKSSWLDYLFRSVRKHCTLGGCVRLFLAAEVTAQAYFTALRKLTGSPLLQGLAEQILHDETEHIRFQAERLALFQAGKSRWWISLSLGFERLIMTVTSLLVWWEHRHLLRAAGFGLGRFRQHCRPEINDALRRMDPASYPDLSAVPHLAKAPGREQAAIGK